MIKKCVHCGKEIVAIRKNKTYCSQRCRHLHVYKYKGAKKGKWVKCNYCDAQVWRAPNRTKRYGRTLCRECHNKTKMDYKKLRKLYNVPEAGDRSEVRRGNCGYA